MRAVVSRGIAQPLTRSAGPWSHMPVHEVVSTDTRPSSEVLPRSTHSSSHSRASIGSEPAMRSVMLSEKRTR